MRGMNLHYPWKSHHQWRAWEMWDSCMGMGIPFPLVCHPWSEWIVVGYYVDWIMECYTKANFGIWCVAMLTVNDDEFWEGVSPVEFGNLPTLQDAVTVVGYPIGGDTISVTSGVVSRIEILSYVHGSTELLGLQVMGSHFSFFSFSYCWLVDPFFWCLLFLMVLQIDAAINSGNSGGPAFNEKGNCVGIAFQSLKHEDAENIGYVIPTPVIKHFIQDYEKNGAYTGMYLIVASTISVDNVLVGFLNSLQFIFVHNFLMIPKW